MKAIYTLSAVALSTLLLTACAETRPAPGKYETERKTISADGTERKTNNTTNIYYDKNGNMRGTVDQETTTDPKGLFNKNTTQSHKTIK